MIRTWPTRYGFAWGPAVVTRLASFERRRKGKGSGRYICIEVETGQVLAPYGDENAGMEPGARKHRLEVYVSPTGSSVRCYLDGEEMLTELQHSRKKR
jgi:hypothetical protein